MNNSQFNGQFNSSNPYLSSQKIPAFSFAGYNLMSLGCTNVFSQYVTEEPLQDVYGDNIEDANGNPLTVDQLRTLIGQKRVGTVGTTIQRMNALDIDNISVEAWESSFSDYGGVINKKYQNKTITLELFIQGADYNDLIARIQELKKATREVEQDFVVTIGGIRRTYKGTVTRIVVPSFPKMQDFIEGISMDILITDTWKGDAISAVYDDITGDTERVIENVGDHDMYAKTVFIFGTTTAVANVELRTRKISDTSGFAVSSSTADLGRIIVSGDILIFDYENKQVLFNGVSKPFTGVMMHCEPGYNVFEFDFSGTVNVDVTVIYNPVYL